MAESFGLPEEAISLENDLVFVYRGLFEPGEGYVVYAGQGHLSGEYFRICTMGEIPWRRLEELERSLAGALAAVTR